MSRTVIDGFTVDLDTENGIAQCWITARARDLRYVGELRRVRIRAALSAPGAQGAGPYYPIPPATLARIEAWAAERGYPNGG